MWQKLGKFKCCDWEAALNTMDLSQVGHRGFEKTSTRDLAAWKHTCGVSCALSLPDCPEAVDVAVQTMAGLGVEQLESLFVMQDREEEICSICW